MTVYPLSTLGPTITSAGITVPAYEDILASLQASYQGTYGQDVNLAPDTQDGAWLAIQAQSIYDCNDAIVSVFNGFSPTYAQGINLSSLVKINGLQRESPTNSTAPCTIVGQAGTVIASGIVSDSFGNQWSLPPALVIPSGGSLSSTLTCSAPGAVTLASGSSTVQPGNALSFVTVVPGWQSLTTTAAAAAGAPVETDAALRQRQSISTGLPAQTPLGAIVANVANLAGVEQYAAYQNDTSETDGNGLPPHSISLIVLGGSAPAIAGAIATKKSPGTGTYGSTSVVVVDPSGVPNTINFYVLDQINAYFILGITPLTGYLSSTGQLAVSAVAAALSGLGIGEDAYVNKLWAPANLSGDAALSVASGLTQPQLDALSATYNVDYIYLGTAPDPDTQSNIDVAFNQAIICPVTNGSVVTV